MSESRALHNAPTPLHCSSFTSVVSSADKFFDAFSGFELHNSLSYLYGSENDPLLRVFKVLLKIQSLSKQLSLYKNNINFKMSKSVENLVPKICAGYHSSKSYYKKK